MISNIIVLLLEAWSVKEEAHLTSAPRRSESETNQQGSARGRDPGGASVRALPALPGENGTSVTAL